MRVRQMTGRETTLKLNSVLQCGLISQERKESVNPPTGISLDGSMPSIIISLGS